MAARKLALWLLNRVAHKEWDHEAMRSALQGGFLGFGGNDVVLGKRSDPNCDPGVLMYEKEGHDEYFIPIPVKCIGNPEALGFAVKPLEHLDHLIREHIEEGRYPGAQIALACNSFRRVPVAGEGREDGMRTNRRKYWDARANRSAGRTGSRPGKTPAASGGVQTARPASQNRLLLVASTTRSSVFNNRASSAPAAAA